MSSDEFDGDFDEQIRCSENTVVRDLDSGELLVEWQCSLPAHPAVLAHTTLDEDGQELAWWETGVEFTLSQDQVG